MPTPARPVHLAAAIPPASALLLVVLTVVLLLLVLVSTAVTLSLVVDVVDTGQLDVHGNAVMNGVATRLPVDVAPESGKTGGWVAISGLGCTSGASGFRTPEIMCTTPFAIKMSGWMIWAEST